MRLEQITKGAAAPFKALLSFGRSLVKRRESGIKRGESKKSESKRLKDLAIDMALFFGAVVSMIFAWTSLVRNDGAINDGSLTVSFYASMVATMISYLCLGTYFFRERGAIARVCAASVFVLYGFPVTFAFAMFANGCFSNPHSELKSMTDYVFISYGVFTGSGPSVTDIDGVCRVVVISESISAYLGLPLLFAVMQSIFPESHAKSKTTENHAEPAQTKKKKRPNAPKSD